MAIVYIMVGELVVTSEATSVIKGRATDHI